MREDLLHYVWKNQKFQETTLLTSSREVLEVIDTGHHNTSSGPDFFNARIRIAGQEWAGNLEIHLKSSDWYAHGHEKDPNYDNVILHVVWEDDVDVFRKDGSRIPTLVLGNCVGKDLLASYQDLVHGKKHKFINCEKDVGSVPGIIWGHWQQRLYVERLQKKSIVIQKLLRETKNDWEAVLFMMLMKNFGLNKNGAAFLGLAKHLDYAVVKKVTKDPLQLESLFFGTAGFLDEKRVLDGYVLHLQKEFEFLVKKFQIGEYLGEKPIFYGLRPSNFPTVRLSQFANLYGQHPHLFSKLMETRTLNGFYTLFNVRASAYWDTHYTFGKESKKRKKGISKDFVHLLLINTLIPIKFSHNDYLGKNNAGELIDLLDRIPPEKNNITKGFGNWGISSSSALDSQAKIQLYNEYCTQNKCLQCPIGTNLLGRKG